MVVISEWNRVDNKKCCFLFVTMVYASAIINSIIYNLVFYLHTETNIWKLLPFCLFLPNLRKSLDYILIYYCILRCTELWFRIGANNPKVDTISEVHFCVRSNEITTMFSKQSTTVANSHLIILLCSSIWIACLSCHFIIFSLIISSIICISLFIIGVDRVLI